MLTFTWIGLVAAALIAGEPMPGNSRFRVTVDPDSYKEPITGRVYVVVAKDPEVSDRLRRSLGHQPPTPGKGSPFFGQDVVDLKPGEVALIDVSAVGYPFESLHELPAGEYYVQAIVNVYTRFEREDGHVIWAHRDQWDGQHFNWAPGNLLSAIRKVNLDPISGFDVTLNATEVIPPIEMPADSGWVRRVKIRSDLLSKFWGQPIDIGATLLLPAGYDDHPDVEYPTIYIQGHFSLEPPFGFSTKAIPETESTRQARLLRGLETGFELFQRWEAPDFPRMVAVTFQHPTPFFDDSYAVNSVNNGPYADALITELIPYLEEQFRLIPEGYARLLTGGSTGGYESLSLQVNYPQVFGGAWVFYPDPVDFRRVFTINIYKEQNAFYASGFGFRPLRYAHRLPDGQPVQSVRQLSQLARALGSRGRSGDYLEAWEAAFGPVSDDGYPRPLWDKETGAIDHEVALYWRDHYDLSHRLKQKWTEIGHDLSGKIRIYCGDMDNYYFNLSVSQLEEVLEATRDPYYSGEFVYGRPEKGHGWRPMNYGELIHRMANQVRRNAPPGADVTMWRYR